MDHIWLIASESTILKLFPAKKPLNKMQLAAWGFESFRWKITNKLAELKAAFECLHPKKLHIWARNSFFALYQINNVNKQREWKNEWKQWWFWKISGILPLATNSGRIQMRWGKKGEKPIFFSASSIFQFDANQFACLCIHTLTHSLTHLRAYTCV